MKHIKQTIFYLVVFVVTLFLAIPVNAAQQQPKAPKASQPVQQQPSVTQSQLPSTLHGHVKFPAGQPVQGAEITLSSIGEGVIMLVRRTTDNTGSYSFDLPFENVGKSYKIIAKYADFPAGMYFTPNEKTFTLATGLITIDFSFNPPMPDLVVDSIVKQQISIYPSEKGWDSKYKLKVTVKNKGMGNAGPFKVLIEKKCLSCTFICVPCPLEVVTSYNVSGLAPGAVNDYILPGEFIDLLMCYYGVCRFNGTNIYGFRATVDSEGDQVIESDENNNQRWLSSTEGQAIENVDPTMIRKRMESMEKKN